MSAVNGDEIRVVMVPQLYHPVSRGRSHRCLCRAGVLLLFELERHILSNILNGSSDEHLSGNFYPHEPRRVDPSILGILFINVKAY